MLWSHWSLSALFCSQVVCIIVITSLTDHFLMMPVAVATWNVRCEFAVALVTEWALFNWLILRNVSITPVHHHSVFCFAISACCFHLMYTETQSQIWVNHYLALPQILLWPKFCQSLFLAVYCILAKMLRTVGKWYWNIFLLFEFSYSPPNFTTFSPFSYLVL